MPALGPVPPVLQLQFTNAAGFLTPTALEFLQLQFTGGGGGGGGSVVGPVSSVAGHFATWNNSTGTLLADGGVVGALAHLNTITASFVTNFDAAVLAASTTQLVAGGGITITPVAGTLVFGASGGGGGTVIGPVSSFNGDLVIWSGAGGTHIADAGAAPGALAFRDTITHSFISDWNAAVQAVVQAQLVAGANIALTPSGVNLIITATSTPPVDYYGAYENNIRPGNTVTTNTTNLNSLISVINANGGGTIYFNMPGNYQINATITLLSFVSIWMTEGAYIDWQGPVGGTIFTTPSTDVMVDMDLKIYVNEGVNFSGIVCDFHSVLNNRIKVTGYGQQTTAGIFAKLFADSSAGGAPYPGLFGNRNTAVNEFSFRHMGVAGTGILMAGITSGFGGGPQGVTDNTFHDCQFANISFRGIKINEWSDSNLFAGNTYIGLSSGANSIGIMVNEGHTNNYSVYNTRWQHVQVDTFGSGLNRTAAVFFESKHMDIDMLFNLPVAENGAFIGRSAGHECLSYTVGIADAANTMTQHTWGYTSVSP